MTITHRFIECEAPKIAKLVNITPITMVYGTQITRYYPLPRFFCAYPFSVMVNSAQTWDTNVCRPSNFSRGIRFHRIQCAGKIWDQDLEEKSMGIHGKMECQYYGKMEFMGNLWEFMGSL